MIHLPERLSQETDRSYAYRTIRENIVHLDLAPGAQISENELARQMHLSRTPVREALMELASVQIVHIVPQKRTTVSLIDNAMVEEALFLRRVLECAVAELVCEQHTPEDLLRLEEQLSLYRFHLENGRPERCLELDDAFHATLFSIAHRERTYDLIRNMQIHFDRVRTLRLEYVMESGHQVLSDHEGIYEAIRNGDAAAAGARMQAHLERYTEDAAAIRAQYPSYFLTDTD